MCGIFGALKYSTYEELYLNNKQRGVFSGGSLYVESKDNVYISKWEGVRDSSELTGDYALVDRYNTFLGHTQAPTSSVREFNIKSTHPFEHGKWIVAHNGVLENDEKLRSDYLTEAIGEYKGMCYNTSDIPVDSAVIPALLDELDVGSDLHTIESVLSKLKGTFAVWMYNKQSGQTFLARSGSTLFGDLQNSVFTSIPVDNIAEDELQEGVVYCITTEGLASVGKFQTNSPFFLF